MIDLLKNVQKHNYIITEYGRGSDNSKNIPWILSHADAALNLQSDYELYYVHHYEIKKYSFIITVAIFPNKTCYMLIIEYNRGVWLNSLLKQSIMPIKDTIFMELSVL